MSTLSSSKPLKQHYKTYCTVIGLVISGLIINIFGISDGLKIISILLGIVILALFFVGDFVTHMVY
jgi:uncharacterized protein YcfJ